MLSMWHRSSTLLLSLSIKMKRYFVVLLFLLFIFFFLIEQTITLFVYIDRNFTLFITLHHFSHFLRRKLKSIVMFFFSSYGSFIPTLVLIPWTDSFHDVDVFFQAMFCISFAHKAIVLIKEEIEIWSMMLIICFFSLLNGHFHELDIHLHLNSFSNAQLNSTSRHIAWTSCARRNLFNKIKLLFFSHSFPSVRCFLSSAYFFS